jgi:hypothetical protein
LMSDPIAHNLITNRVDKADIKHHQKYSLFHALDHCVEVPTQAGGFHRGEVFASRFFQHSSGCGSSLTRPAAPDQHRLLRKLGAVLHSKYTGEHHECRMA